MTRAESGGPVPEGPAPTVITALTGVRGLAALWVVLFHLRHELYELLPASRHVSALLDNGMLGVDVFFALSGFVISHNYADRLARRARGGYRAFLAARVARIYPAHLVALVAVAGLVAHQAWSGTTLDPGQHFTVGTFLGNVLMLQALPGIAPWNYPAWSISCEFAAYLVFPLAAASLVRLRPRTALALAALLMSALVAVTLLPPLSSVEATYWIRIAVEFSAGCLLWAVMRAVGGPGRRWDLVAVAAVATAVVLLAARVPVLWAVPFLTAFVVAVAASAGPVRAVLAIPALEWGGRISYSVYLAHAPVIAALTIWFLPSAYSGAPLWLRGPVALGCVVAPVAVGALLHYAVERPGRAWLKRRSPAWPVAAAPDRRAEVVRAF